ncbi:AAA family ATPase [candidate division KSB1 bacterium]|nr:AAA family ATPase [candidate division KSB1 bacterium]
MLTRIHIKNFKRFDDVDIDLGKTVVLIGPNNSGKTTALQALALWDIGLRRWNEKRQGKSSPEERPGVTINRRDMTAIPVPDANLLWRDLRVRDVRRVDGKNQTQNVRIDITVDGITNGKSWSCGLEFDYANEESFYCRPLRLNDDKPPKRLQPPLEAAGIKVAFLPPMSGLADREFIKQPGEINVLIGQGQTAQVLRNLCHQVYVDESKEAKWQELASHIKRLFGIDLMPPVYIKERSEITMAYRDVSGVQLDLSSSGRGLQQTVLLLAHIYANPGTVLLLDEPDAHLEVLRQRQIYQLLSDVAEQQSAQIIAASHSEVVLNEAAGRDVVVAFVGKPHRIDGRGSQVLKSLTDLGFDQYYQAEQTGWVLYLEGPSDLAVLQAFAATLEHPAAQWLERPFVHYVSTNLPQKARDHFYGLREAKQDLVGIALFDRLDKELQESAPLVETMWRRKEVENYLCLEEVLLAYASADQADDLFGQAETKYRANAMRETISEVSAALKTLGKQDPWSPDIKASDDFFDPLFKKYFEKLGLPNLMRKTDYHVLARLVPKGKIDPEVIEKLDVIVAVAKKAKPRG